MLLARPFKRRKLLSLEPCRRAIASSCSCRAATIPAADLSKQHLPPLNKVCVPLISPNLRAQLFPLPSSPFAPPSPSSEATKISISHLTKHQLLPPPPSSKPSPPAIDFTLPPLLGPTITHHFHHLGNFASSTYRDLATSFSDQPDPPPRPLETSWSFTPGWTVYHRDGSFEPIAYPPEEERTLVFDVETLPHVGGHWAIMAVAMGKEAWYGWVSPWLTGASDSPAHLIPLFKPVEEEKGGKLRENEGEERLVVGHNVLFDRARCEGEYELRRPGTRWLDTMSLHIAVSGLTNPQRPGWMKYRKERDAGEEEEDLEDSNTAEKKKPISSGEKSWQEVSAMNSLVEVARLHCGIKADKSVRSILVNPHTTLEDAQATFSTLMDYCASDVDITYQVYNALLPRFLQGCPHPASFAGALLMSQPVLPVNSKWPQYLERSEKAYEDRREAVNEKLLILAEEARKLHDVKDSEGNYVWETDVQLRGLDWSPKRARRLPLSPPSPGQSITPVSPASTPAFAAPKPAWAIQKIDLHSPIAPLLLRTTYKNFPVVFCGKDGWAFAVPTSKANKFVAGDGEAEVAAPEGWTGYKLFAIPAAGRRARAKKLLTKALGPRFKDGTLGDERDVSYKWLLDPEDGEATSILQERIEAALDSTASDRKADPWLRQLDWTLQDVEADDDTDVVKQLPSSVDRRDLVWPKWYHDLDVVGEDRLDLTIKKRVTPLLLKLRWKGYPIVHSKEHGWVYRIPGSEVAANMAADPSLSPLEFKLLEDTSLSDDDAAFIRLPHPDGESKNVGNPLSKPFLAAAEEGTMSSVFPVAKEALALNAECSYWASARERIINQMVIWDGSASAPAPPVADAQTVGLILPQVTPMGTITRRAVERTWLTASNAKKNRVGSELKSMVRAPPGYAIVGADVDSEELWICSVMGDAQFGIHGATAVGWMTLEGTKSAGTDLHSKTASILGISRDHAKVFNYSRIYGAGVAHAVVLLLKANPTLSADDAKKLAQNLYAQTKGLVHRGPAYKRDFWHGGTESFVFNKLEGIARSDKPKTPAFGCGLTTALTRKFLPAEGRSKAGEGFLPSRINWVVQSSGVDYLHALLVSMDYLAKRFDIDMRYMISVHDEVRYLVKEEDKYRAAMALQIANIWTRALFCFRLQMPDLPQSCAFFSAVDIDTCFRKEVNMPCTTPSNPDAIPFGQSFDISDSLNSTSNGSLFADGASMASLAPEVVPDLQLSGVDVAGEPHRVSDTSFLEAQTLEDVKAVNTLWNRTRPKAAAWPARAARSRSSSPPRSHTGLTKGDLDESAFLLNDLKSSRPATPRQREKSHTLEKLSEARMASYVRPEEYDWFNDSLVPDEVEEDEYSVTKQATRRATV